MKKLLYLLVFIVACGNSVVGQDIHYSQYYASPQNLNPAQTGLFNGDWRFAGNYRGQWAAIPVPYKTFSLAADNRLNTKLKKDVVAAGILLNSDKAGDSRFSTTQMYVTGSYIKKLTKDSMNFLSVAIQPGISSKGFNVNELTFDNQYDGDSYNPNLGSGENFSRMRITYFDLGGGVAYLWKKNERMQANIGVSFLHLNKPKQSFFDNRDIRLDMKTAFSGIVQLPVSAKLDVLPAFMYQAQGKFHETLIGAFAKYYLKPVNGLTTAVSLGAEVRAKDAFIVIANMDYRNFTVGMSYDVNTSRLIAATNRRGAFEISVIYIFRKARPFVSKLPVCPVYM